MGLVLAIDPGRRQGKALDRLTQEFHQHEVVVATSGDEALAVLDGLVPDLLLFPLFIAPGDEAKLQSRLDALPAASEFKALTIPLRAFFDWEVHATRPAAVPPRWFYWFKPVGGLPPDLADPLAFANAVRSDLGRPRAGASIADPVPAPVAPPLAALPASVHVQPPPPAYAPPPPTHESSLAPWTASAPPVATAAVEAPLASTPHVSAFRSESPSPRSSQSPTFSLSPGTHGTSGTSGTDDRRPDPGEPLPDTGEDGPEAVSGRGIGGVWSSIGPALASLWRLAQQMPRGLQVGIPAVAVLLTLGMTGNLTPLLSLPGRAIGAATQRYFPEQPKTGTAEIQTVPDGAQVWYQGRQLGVTPLRSEFAIGAHEVELRYRNTTRTVTLEITPGNTFVQRVEWGTPRVTGKLRVESDPPGASVMVDGKPRGVTPLNVDDLVVGKHTVDVSLSGNVVHETVDVKAAKTATVRTSIYQGWLALFSPIDVKVAADGRPLTLDDQGRVMLPSGVHQLTVQNRALGYTETRTVEIKPGDTTPFSVVVPKTTLSITTSSPAEAWVDGEPVGSTPVANVPVDIGTREVLVRSAEHGERRATVTAATDPASVAIDFTSSAP